MSILTQDFVLSAIASEKAGAEFPIDFDDVWQSTGYSRKDHAVRFLRKRLRLNQDYRSPDRGRSSKGEKYFLTVDGFKFFLAKSNTTQGDETLWYFIEIEKAYRAQLERQLETQFTRPATPSPAGYCHTFWKVWADSGIKDPWYVRRVIVANHDYREVNKLVCVSHDVYTELVLTFRSQAGANPAELPIELQPLFREFEEKRKNTRAAQLK